MILGIVDESRMDAFNAFFMGFAHRISKVRMI
jgi:hypothetical protein